MKGSKQPPIGYFNLSEFECQCKHSSCVNQEIDPELIRQLNSIRLGLGAPLKVTSGYRCAKHQDDLRRQGAETVGPGSRSQHELGRAADLKTSDMRALEALAHSHFKAVGVARTFIHVDLRDDKSRSWTYQGV